MGLEVLDFCTEQDEDLTRIHTELGTEGVDVVNLDLVEPCADDVIDWPKLMNLTKKPLIKLTGAMIGVGVFHINKFCGSCVLVKFEGLAVDDATCTKELVQLRVL